MALPKKGYKRPAALPPLEANSPPPAEENDDKYNGVHRKLRIPKSEYDEDGRPILNIDVDGINLQDSMDKLLG